MSSASKARCVLPLGTRAGCSGTKSGRSTCQGKALRTLSGGCAPTEHGSLCKLQPLNVVVAETDTFHTEQWRCSSGTLELSVPWQWPGLGRSKKSKKRTNQYPILIIFHSSYPIFRISYTCVHSAESHCTTLSDNIQLLKSPCVADSYCPYWQLFQRTIAKHCSYNIAMKLISLPQSLWWPALCLTSDECITLNSEACLKKHWPSKNLLYSSLSPPVIYPRTQSSNVKEIDFDSFNYYTWLFLTMKLFLGEEVLGTCILPQLGMPSVSYFPLFYNCIMSKKSSHLNI